MLKISRIFIVKKVYEINNQKLHLQLYFYSFLKVATTSNQLFSEMFKKKTSEIFYSKG